MLHPRRNRDRAGFSLIELLAALAITIAIAMVLLPFAGQLMLRWWAGPVLVQDGDHVMQALRRISDDLNHALPIAPKSGETQMLIATSDSLEFIRPPFQSDRLQTLKRIRVRIRHDRTGDEIYRSSQEVSDFTDAPGHEDLILRTPWSMTFRVYDRGLKTVGTKASLTSYVSLEFARIGQGVAPPPAFTFPVPARDPVSEVSQASNNPAPPAVAASKSK